MTKSFPKKPATGKVGGKAAALPYPGKLPAPNTPPNARQSPAAVITQPMVTPAPQATDLLTRGGQSAGRPGQIVTAANRWRENYNPLRGLTMRRVVELLELGQRGDYAYLQWAYRFIERRNPTLSGLISRCEAPFASFDWSIRVKSTLPPGGTKAMAERQKESLTQFVANRGNATVNLIVPIRSFVATAIAARQFWAALFAQLNAGLVDLQVLDASSADATYMPACSIGDVTPDQNDGERGVALFYTLKFTGNNFTTTAP